MNRKIKIKKPRRPRRQRSYVTVPNLFTVLNILCGFLSVLQVLSSHYVNAAWLIWLAAIFDALDGRIARASGRSSEFGLQMDSLSDVVSFGLAPSVLVYQVQLHKLHPPVGMILAFFPLLFAAFRLARFNVITMQSGKGKDYVGLPAPSAALTLAGLIILYFDTHWEFLMRFLVVLVPLVGLLMASSIRYEGFPRFNFKEKGANRIRLVVFLLSLAAFFIYPQYILFPFCILFIIAGIARALLKMFQEEDADIAIIPEEEPTVSDNEMTQ
ncbi:CDP-diacylglycerol--serine O-phosphatidyltransferase [candidate division KSB1 bacterium]|nr:CDP-diacylglycerol--serine O-phosphatidyltransferase [candidate division KSB1 bacterium]